MLRRIAKSRLDVLLLTLVASLASGCVQRYIAVDTVPTGAELFIDGRKIGPTPQRVPFVHYGQHELMLRHAATTDTSGEKAYYETRVLGIDIGPPGYELFPLDLFFEHLIPFHIVDERSFVIDLETHDPRTEISEFEKEAQAHGVDLVGATNGEPPKKKP